MRWLLAAALLAGCSVDAIDYAADVPPGAKVVYFNEGKGLGVSPARILLIEGCLVTEVWDGEGWKLTERAPTACPAKEE